MFVIDEALLQLTAKSDQVVALSEAINQPHVAVPGKEAQPAYACVAVIKNGDSSYSVYIHLFLAISREAVVYVPERKKLTGPEAAAAEAEALQFVESMGFMLDNLNFRELEATAQQELLARLPAFLAPSAVTSTVSTGGQRPLSGGPSMTAALATPPTPGPLGAARLDPTTPGPNQALAPKSPAATPEQALQLARLLASF